MTPDELAEAIDKSISKHFNLDTHKEQHDFVKAWMAKEKRKQEIWDKAKSHVLGWGLVAIIIWLISTFKDHFRWH